MDHKRQHTVICRARDLPALFAHSPSGTMLQHMLRMGVDERPEFFSNYVRHWCPRCLAHHQTAYSGPVQAWQAPACKR